MYLLGQAVYSLAVISINRYSRIRCGWSVHNLNLGCHCISCGATTLSLKVFEQARLLLGSRQGLVAPIKFTVPDDYETTCEFIPADKGRLYNAFDTGAL